MLERETSCRSRTTYERSRPWKVAELTAGVVIQSALLILLELSF